MDMFHREGELPHGKLIENYVQKAPLGAKCG